MCSDQDAIVVEYDGEKMSLARALRIAIAKSKHYPHREFHRLPQSDIKRRYFIE